MKFTIKILHLKFSEILFCILMISMIFFSFGMNYISDYFQYIDDLFVIIFIFFALLKTIINSSNRKLNKYDRNLFFLGCILIIVGLIGNFISQYQTNIKAILIDILSFCKWFGTYLAGMIIFDQNKGDRYFEIAEYFAKVILIIIAFIAIFNQILDLGLGEKYGRYGLPSYTLGGHPSFAAAIGCFCTSILLLNYSKNKKWIVVGFILIALTLRIKAIAYVLIMILFLLFNKNKKSFSIKSLFIYFIIAIIVARKYIVAYFFDVTASRGMALIASFKLASTFFPIGAGFATFGTTGSTISYSMAYKILGLSTRYGFMENASAFVGDGGWATQIGQFGIIGVIIMLIMFYLMYCSVRKNVGKTINSAPYISIFLYLLICSTSETSISSNYAILLALALVIIVKKGQKKYEIGKKEEQCS